MTRSMLFGQIQDIDFSTPPDPTVRICVQLFKERYRRALGSEGRRTHKRFDVESWADFFEQLSVWLENHEGLNSFWITSVYGRSINHVYLHREAHHSIPEANDD